MDVDINVTKIGNTKESVMNFHLTTMLNYSVKVHIIFLFVFISTKYATIVWLGKNVRRYRYIKILIV